MKPNTLYQVALLSMSLASLPAFAAVTARVDHNAVSEGETVQLTLERDDRSGGNPDLSPLHQDFDVLSTSRGTSIQFVNGAMSQQQQVQISLSPKHAGRLQIPALSWGGETTAAINLEVASGGASPSSTNAPAEASDNAHVFLSSTLDPPRPYVQGAATLTVTLHTDLPLQNASLDFQGSSDIAVQQIGKDRSSTEVRNGHRYQTVERSYQLTPLRSGLLTLPGATLDAQVPDTRNRNPFDDDDLFSRAFGNSPFAGMMGALKPLRLHGKEVQLDAQPRPAAATGPDWLPAQSVTVDSRWQPDTGAIRAGEPLNLHLRMTAKGLSAAQLPDLAARLQLPDGLKAYPDPAKLDTSSDDSGVTGSREQDIALIASQPGRYRIPALHLQWWDTAADAAREVTLPAHEVTIDAAAADGGTMAATPPAVAAAPSISPAPTIDQASARGAATATPANRPWMLISAALAVVWVITLLLWGFWWRQHRRSSGPASAKKTPATATTTTTDPASGGAALRRFKAACQSNDAAAARTALLDWGKSRWPDAPPAGLAALATRLDDAALTPLLMGLDRATYTASSWRGEALATAFKSAAVPDRPSERRAPVLGALYGG